MRIFRFIKRVLFAFLFTFVPGLITIRVYLQGPDPAQHSLLVGVLTFGTLLLAFVGWQVAKSEFP